MGEIRLRVSGEPITQGSMKIVSVRGRAQVVHDKDALLGWRDRIAWQVRGASRLAPPLEGPVSVTLMFWLTRPKSHFTRTGALRSSAPAYPTAKRDLDKLVRGVLDALTMGMVWKDDGQVIDLDLKKRWASAAEEPGVYIHAREFTA